MLKSILPEKLKSFDYYKNKLPLYLQNSHGFIEHFRIMHTLLVDGVTDNADVLLNLLNIYDSEYLAYINSFEESESGTVSDILDKIGALVGVSRNFTIVLNNTEKALHLDNASFLLLIKAQLIRSYCDGTFAELREFYDNIGLDVYITTSSFDCTSEIFLADNSGTSLYDENIKDMFEAGLLHVKSMGINYTFAICDINATLRWDNLIGFGWDRGHWGI